MIKSILQPDERIALFIDGFSVYSIAKSLVFDIDFGKLLKLFTDEEFNTRVLRANYFVSMYDTSTTEENILKPMVDWLAFNGYRVVSKTRRDFLDKQGNKRSKTNVNVEMVVDMFDQSEFVDHIVIFSGDGDLRYAIESLQRRGKRITVVSSKQTETAAVSDDLRKQADNFIEIADLKSQIERKRKQ
jgi:uncharacterized LabA/DUF88 family protein